MKRYLVYGLFADSEPIFKYIGSTTRPLEKRLEQHIREARTRIKPYHWWIINNKGKVRIRLLAEASSYSEMRKWEREFIERNKETLLNLLHVRKKGKWLAELGIVSSLVGTRKKSTLST